MLSCLLHRPTDSNDDIELNGPDIADKTFEVGMINSSNINPKTFAQFDHQIMDNQCTKEELNLPGYDLVTEQIKDRELLKLKELQGGMTLQLNNSKYICWIMCFTTCQRLIQIQSFGCTFLNIYGKRELTIS